jgi:hypothetical protein
MVLKLKRWRRLAGHTAVGRTHRRKQYMQKTQNNNTPRGFTGNSQQTMLQVFSKSTTSLSQRTTRSVVRRRGVVVLFKRGSLSWPLPQHLCEPSDLHESKEHLEELDKRMNFLAPCLGQNIGCKLVTMPLRTLWCWARPGGFGGKRATGN